MWLSRCLVMPPVRCGFLNIAHLVVLVSPPGRAQEPWALPGPHSLRGTKVAQQFEGFFPLKDICISEKGKLISGNIWEHLVLKTLSEQCAKYWTDAACLWPSCNAYYCQLLLNKTRERPLQSGIHFQLVLIGLTVFASSLLLMKPGRAKCVEVDYSICACTVGSINNLTNSYFWKEILAFNLLNLFFFFFKSHYLCILFSFALLVIHLTLKSVCNKCWLVLPWMNWRPSCMYFL